MSEDFTRAEPHDVDAERAVLSAMIDGPGGIDAAVQLLDPEDFYRPAHQVIFQALVVMRAANEPVTVPTLAEWIIREGDGRSIGGDHGRDYLFSLWQLHQPWVTIRPHAGIIRDRAARRRWLQAAARIEQMARTKPDVDVLAAAGAAEADAAALFAGEYSARATRLSGIKAFMTSPHAAPAPVIPGMLNRMDRVVVVAGGGTGKTVLALQVGAAASVGLDPFGRDRYDPARVLFIDLEMPAYLLHAGLDLVMPVARQYGDPDQDGRFQIIHRPRGLDLADRGQAHMLAGLIRKAEPDLIIAGPVYKMHGDTGERAEHTAVMDFWDDIRDRYTPALWLETHPAKDRFGKPKTLTPSGSHRWGDWPEIGFGLVPGKTAGQYDVRPFRGMRDRNRAWPESLQVRVGPGFPWQATYPQGTFGEPP